MTADHDAATDGGTDADADESIDANTDGEIDADDGPPGRVLGRVSRRGVLGTLAALGLAGAASQPASAASTTLEFGGSYTGDPGSNFGLRLEPDNARFGMLGFSETGDGRGLVGRATAASGSTIGVLGRAESPDGVAMQGQNDATSGTAYGGFFRTFSTGGRGFLGIAEADSGSTFGAIGKSRSTSGTGVEGNATASSGETYGVIGRVSSPAGYGLYTPQDARIEGTIDTTETDFTVEAGTTSTGDARNVVHGHASNAVKDSAIGGVVGGGGFDDGSRVRPNVVTDNYGTVAGGQNNTAGSDADDDPATAEFATVGGGQNNTASGRGATVAGGLDNVASAECATVAGGRGNEASGSVAAIPGGFGNTADGAFVLGDSSEETIQSGGPDEVRSQMPVFAPAFETTSARSEKTDIESVDPGAVLTGVESLEVSTWEFDHQDNGRHMGPMAGDFHEQFALGSDAEHIATVDADGVALAAIQGLSQKLDDRDDRIDELQARNEAFREDLTRKDDRIDELEDRLTALEERVETDVSGDD